MDDAVRRYMAEMARKRWAGTTKAERREALARARAVRDADEEKRLAAGKRLTAARKAAQARRQSS